MPNYDKLPPIFDTATLAEWSGMPVRRWADYRAQGIGPNWFRAGDGARQVLYTRDAVETWVRNKEGRAPSRFGRDTFGAAPFAAPLAQGAGRAA